jgi:hypothetical protein
VSSAASVECLAADGALWASAVDIAPPADARICGAAFVAASFKVMSRRPTEDDSPDLFSTERLGESSARKGSKATAARLGRPILPKDLAKAMTYLDDKEFDRLFRATVDEAERRGTLSKRLKASLTTQAVDADRATKMKPAMPKPG